MLYFVMDHRKVNSWFIFTPNKFSQERSFLFKCMASLNPNHDSFSSKTMLFVPFYQEWKVRVPETVAGRLLLLTLAYGAAQGLMLPLVLYEAAGEVIRRADLRWHQPAGDIELNISRYRLIPR